MSGRERTTERAIAAARAAVTSFVITMSLFDTPPPIRERPRYAIVRTLGDQPAARIDPREVVRDRIVLTLPFSEAEGTGEARAPEFLAN